jgi:hypothetical protein
MQEDTARIGHDELVGLLDTTRSPDQQRITAEMPAVQLDDLLQPDLPPEIIVTFRTSAPPPRRRVRQMAANLVAKIGWRRADPTL